MIKAVISDFRKKLQGVSFAYNRVFDRKSVHAEVVLKDLARFCRAHSTTFLPDARAHAVLEGRREVWLKIQEHLHLTEEEIYRLHAVKEYIPPKEVGNEPR